MRLKATYNTCQMGHYNLSTAFMGRLGNKQRKLLSMKEGIITTVARAPFGSSGNQSNLTQDHTIYYCTEQT